MGCTTEVSGSISDRRKEAFLHSFQTESAILITSYPVGTGALSLGLKREERESDNLPLFMSRL
jgi:hypothetical protein